MGATGRGRRLLFLGVDRPRSTIAAVLAVTAALSLFLPRLRVDADGRELLSPDHPARRQDAELRARFGIREALFLAIIPRSEGGGGGGPGSIPADATVILGRALAREMAAVPGLSGDRQVSLSALQPGPGSEVPDDVHQTLRSPLLRSLLVGRDGRSLGMMLPVEEDVPGDQVLANARAAVGQLEVPDGHEVLLAGEAIVERELSAHVLEDFVRTIPAVAVLAFLALVIALRSPAAAGLALAEALVSAVWAFGLMGLAGVPIQLTSALVPALILAVGVCDELHLHFALARARAESPGEDRTAHLRRALGAVGPALLVASATTIASFAAFQPGGLAAVQRMSLALAFGIAASTALTLWLVPAVWTLVGLPRASGAGSTAPAPPAGPGPLDGATGRLRGATLLACAVLVLLAGLGASRLRVDDSWTANFDPESEMRRAEVKVNGLFAGTNRLLLELDSGEAGGWEKEERARALSAFESSIRALPGVGATLSLASFREEIQRRAPRDPPRGVVEALTALASAPGYHLARSLLSPDGRYAAIHVFLPSASLATVSAVMREAEASAPEMLGAVPVRFGGNAYVSEVLVDSIVQQQISSLGLSALLCFPVVLLVLRRIRLAVLAFVPALLASVLVLGVMGAASIPLGVSTSMIAALTVGIAIDYAVYLAATARAQGGGGGFGLALRAIATDAVVVSAALLGLLFARTPPLRMFGILGAVALMASAGFTVALRPWLTRPTRER